MILENCLDKWNYAVLLIPDIHKEYLLEPQGGTRCSFIYDPYLLSSICPDTDKAQQALYDWAAKFLPPIDDFDPSMHSLWYVQGTVEGLIQVMARLAQNLAWGPGGDDDTFDYWPNAFSMVIALSMDIITLDPSCHGRVVSIVEAVVKAVEAIKGPASEWEAEFIHEDLARLQALTVGEA